MYRALNNLRNSLHTLTCHNQVIADEVLNLLAEEEFDESGFYKDDIKHFINQASENTMTRVRDYDELFEFLSEEICGEDA